MDSVMKQAREYVGYSRRVIAKHLGVTVHELDEWEAGLRTPPEDCLRVMARAYRRSAEDLLKPGPDEVPALDAETDLAAGAAGATIGDRMELSMFARFLRHRKGDRP